MIKLLAGGERTTTPRTTLTRTRRRAHHFILDHQHCRHPNLRSRPVRRTCYESPASYNPDTQGTPNWAEPPGNQSYTNRPTPSACTAGPFITDTGGAHIQGSGPSCLTASHGAGSDPHRRHVVHTKPIPLQAIPATRFRERAFPTGRRRCWP